MLFPTHCLQYEILTFSEKKFPGLKVVFACRFLWFLRFIWFPWLPQETREMVSWPQRSFRLPCPTVPIVPMVPMAPSGAPGQVIKEIVSQPQGSCRLPFPMVPIVPMAPPGDTGQVTSKWFLGLKVVFACNSLWLLWFLWLLCLPR